MDQLHRRFTTEQVKALLQGYCEGTIGRAELEEIMGIGKTRLFAMLKLYRRGPDAFSLTYERATPAKLLTNVETEIEKELR